METTTMGYIGVIYMDNGKENGNYYSNQRYYFSKCAPLYTPLEKHGPEACKTSHFQGLQASLERSAGYTEARGIR